MFFDYNNVTVYARPSLFKYYVIFENSVVIQYIKVTFFSENKLFDNKESSLTKEVTIA